MENQHQHRNDDTDHREGADKLQAHLTHTPWRKIKPRGCGASVTLFGEFSGPPIGGSGGGPLALKRTCHIARREDVTAITFLRFPGGAASKRDGYHSFCCIPL
jgi:hypothetical protein